MREIIVVQGFCLLKINITQFLNGFRLNLSCKRDKGIIATSTYMFDSHMFLPSYRYGCAKSLDGIAGTWHGLLDEGSGKREYRCRCYHQIPERYKIYHELDQ